MFSTITFDLSTTSPSLFSSALGRCPNQVHNHHQPLFDNLYHRIMPFLAETLLQLVMLITWTVLNDTPATQKQAHYTKFLPSQDVLEAMVSKVSLVFAPGLFEVLKDAMPPTVEYFKTLPTVLEETPKRWAVYLLVLEKTNCRPRI
jgi:hypothetical protein